MDIVLRRAAVMQGVLVSLLVSSDFRRSTRSTTDAVDCYDGLIIDVNAGPVLNDELHPP